MQPLTAPSGAVINLRELIMIPSSLPIDSDQDGIGDLVELALGSNPNQLLSIPSPQATRTTISSGPTPSFTIRRPTNQAGNFSYIVEWSDDLISWTSDSSTLSAPTVTPIDASWEDVRVDSLKNMELNPRQFFRLKIGQQHISGSP